MKFAYADPPYIGMAHRYPEKTEVDHAELISQLERDFPDGWALSLHTPSLRTILPMCPDDARVLAWVKPWCSWKPGVRVAYAWEPVIVRGGRPRSRKRGTVRDWIAASATRKRGLCGAKPEAFAFWMFEVLGMEPTDDLVDLYPGSKAVTKAWQAWRSSLLPRMSGGARSC